MGQNKMTTQLQVTQSLDSIDLQLVAQYAKKLSDVGNAFNKIMAPTFIRDFIIGYDIISVQLAKAIETEIKAKSMLETTEAIAYLDGAPEFFKTRDEKPTVESRKAYVAMDQDVIRAKELYARSVAMVSLLKSKAIEFKAAIDCTRDLARDGYMTPHENS